MLNELPTKLVVAALIGHPGQLLIARRKSSDRFPGLWEFPGGKVKPGESPEEALRRECREELAIEIRVDAIREVIFHRYESFSVLLLFYDCEIIEGEPQPLGCERIEWATPERLGDYEFLPADKTLLEKLQRA